ncbi:hypothetical protein F5148DRAFT_559957 [Russula earlei]|uniref:Uncharacterized protein n=1 Tax=Russula earlei TaxID=71964 RepID=A0ACC0UN68_9AGAM|nr:hypothetical protein F5148DRAFT_559957 [Russula earlei]
MIMLSNFTDRRLDREEKRRYSMIKRPALNILFCTRPTNVYHDSTVPSILTFLGVLFMTPKYYYGLYRSFVHILDNDSLLNIIYYCRPVLIDEDQADENDILLGGEWCRERWWYKLAHVCRRWRCLILSSSSHLGLRLVCTYGTPVADMLAHSPPLPLIIDYTDKDREATAEDDEGILIALQHRNRVRWVRVWRPVPNLEKLIMAIDEEFPMLEYLYIGPSTKHDTSLILPKTLQAPHLRHLILYNFTFPIGSPFLTTIPALVTLSLNDILPSDFLPLDVFLRQLSLIPQLEMLGIRFRSPIPDIDIQRQLLRSPIMTYVILPNLHSLSFKGTSAYLEAFLARITAPVLEKLQIVFFNQLIFSIPHLLQFTSARENLRFRSARIKFSTHGVDMRVEPREGTRACTFHMHVICQHLDWQVGSAAQIFNALRTVFSAVKSLTLEYGGHGIESEFRQEADRTEWHELLRSFNRLKNLRVDNDLIQEVSRSLQVENEGSLKELLPELKELPVTEFSGAASVSSPIRSVAAGVSPIGSVSGCLVSLSLPAHITRSTLQQFQLQKIPPLSEDGFKRTFARFTSTGPSGCDLIIEGRQINLWALHKAVFLRNGFDSVTTNDEWPVIGAALGFPSFTGGDAGQPARCAPAVALRLQQIYAEVLRHFDQAYIDCVITRLKNSQTSGPMPQIPQSAQTQALPHQTMKADYQALFLASITSKSSVMNSDVMSILPRFSHTYGADLEARRVPQHVIASVEQNREHLQRAAQGQKGFRAGLTSAKNHPLDNTQGASTVATAGFSQRARKVHHVAARSAI